MARNRERTWAVEDHLCRHCGGRILRCVTGNGVTGGGNPVFKCADCGSAVAAMGPERLCWCGFEHRRNAPGAYMCLPFSVLEESPWLRDAFAACGTDPERGEVGIILSADYTRLRQKHEREEGCS